MANIEDKGVRKNIFDKFNGRCAYCGCDLSDNSFQIDHIKPVRVRNRKTTDFNVYSNFNPSCSKCNSSKGDKSIEEWRSNLQGKLDALKETSVAFRIAINNRPINSQIIFYFESINQ